MNKKHTLKDFPELPTGDVFKSEDLTDDRIVKTLIELAGLYDIEYELKIENTNMKDKTKRVAELFKQEMQKAPAFKTVTKFLWFPKTIEGTTKWLVSASWQEQFIEIIDDEALQLGALNCFNWIWKPVKWI